MKKIVKTFIYGSHKIGIFRYNISIYNSSGTGIQHHQDTYWNCITSRMCNGRAKINNLSRFWDQEYIFMRFSMIIEKSKKREFKFDKWETWYLKETNFQIFLWPWLGRNYYGYMFLIKFQIPQIIFVIRSKIYNGKKGN